MAVDAIRAAATAHSFLSVTEQGLAAIVTTHGNLDCHVVLRGGRDGPNYDANSVQQALERMRAVDVLPRVMIDASHENSGKDYRRQPAVAREIAAQVAGGEAGIVGVMLESFLVEGRQELQAKAALVYGQSITDSCMSWRPPSWCCAIWPRRCRRVERSAARPRVEDRGIAGIDHNASDAFVARAGA